MFNYKPHPKIKWDILNDVDLLVKHVYSIMALHYTLFYFCGGSPINLHFPTLKQWD
jgi:hypothetical protein